MIASQTRGLAGPQESPLLRHSYDSCISRCWWVVASPSVVEEFGDVLVVTPPVGPGECMVGLGNFRQDEPNHQSPDLRNGERNQWRSSFCERGGIMRDRITDNVA